MDDPYNSYQLKLTSTSYLHPIDSRRPHRCHCCFSLSRIVARLIRSSVRCNLAPATTDTYSIFDAKPLMSCYPSQGLVRECAQETCHQTAPSDWRVSSNRLGPFLREAGHRPLLSDRRHCTRGFLPNVQIPLAVPVMIN